MQDTPTAEPAATETTAPANLVIAPETLGQMRFFWNAEFPGEINDSDVNIGCDPGQEICTFQTNITDYAFSPDGNTLAVGVCEGLRTVDQTNRNSDFYGCAGESAIILYDSITGKERGRLAPESLPLSLAFHPDGTILAAGLSNSDIQLWDLSSNAVTNTLSGSPQFVGVNRLAFTPDGNLLISGTRGKNPISINRVPLQVLIWDWRSSELQTTFDQAFRFAISPDGAGLLITYFGPADALVIRIYDLAQLDQFLEISLEGQVTPADFSFNPINGWISGTEAQLPSVANFWDPASQSLVASLDYDQEYDETGMLYDLNSGGFTPDGYFLVNRSGELLAPEAQPEATGLEETLWECGFALADVEANQIYYTSHPMLSDECFGPPYMYLSYLGQPLILSPDGRFIAGDDGFGSLRLWGIDPSLPAVKPACYGDC